MVHFKKGSAEAKAYMARLRAMRGKGCRGRGCRGGSIWGTLGSLYAKSLGKWIKGWREEDVAQRRELKRLRGGKIEGKDVVDFFAGPLGWIKMGIRKKRQKEIDALRKARGYGYDNDLAYVTKVLSNPQMRRLLKARFEDVCESEM